MRSARLIVPKRVLMLFIGRKSLFLINSPITYNFFIVGTLVHITSAKLSTESQPNYKPKPEKCSIH